MSDTMVKRPLLTFPEAEAAHVRAAYAQASVILEYGSGGSTAYAADLDGKTVFSVESDRAWMDNLQDYLDQESRPSDITLHHADIGATKAWGHPAVKKSFQSWPGYALSVWDRADFKHPDLVLIDGRFRPACFFATLMRIERPVTVLFDDYTERQNYHFVEDHVPLTTTIGRMAEFTLTPGALNPKHFSDVVQSFIDPR